MALRNGNSYSNPCLQKKQKDKNNNNKTTTTTKKTKVQQQQQGCYDITNHYNNDSGTIKSVEKNCSRRYTYGVRVRVFPVEAIMKLGFCFPIL
jgi:hypothetical protein